MFFFMKGMSIQNILFSLNLNFNINILNSLKIYLPQTFDRKAFVKIIRQTMKNFLNSICDT